MKKIYTTIIIALISINGFGQVLCVQCFHQNDSIGVNVGANNLIINGGFENTTCGFYTGTHFSFCPTSGVYNCDIANWTSGGGGNSTYACFLDSNSMFIPQGSRAPYFGNNYCNPCWALSSTYIGCLTFSGCTVVGMPAGFPENPDTIHFGGANGVYLEQTVNGLVPGNTYVLEFWAGGEDGSGMYTGRGLFAVDVGFGNIFLRDYPTPAHTGVGNRFLIQFNATSTSHTIKFTNWGHISYTCTELALDDVRLYPPLLLPASVTTCTVDIPEPLQNSISIFPNPISDEITINLAKEYKKIKIEITDIQGKRIYSSEEKQNNLITLDFEANKGLYFVRVIADENSWNLKLVKE